MAQLSRLIKVFRFATHHSLLTELKRPARSLAHHGLRPLVRGAAGEGFSGPVRPEDVDGVHVTDRAQAEVRPRVVAAEVAVTRIDPPHPAAPAGPDRDLGAV